MRTVLAALAVCAPAQCTLTQSASAEDLTCVDTAWALFGNHKVCVSAFDDEKVSGVTCHISQARTGGAFGALGLASDKSEFSISCRQIGPISTDLSKLPQREDAFTAKTSIFFKATHVVRVVDAGRKTLVYLAISDKLIDGSPKNSISTVPVMPWQ